MSRFSRKSSACVAVFLVAGLPGIGFAHQQATSGAAPLSWADCQPGQIEVMVLGTFHFEQSADVDVLEDARQVELGDTLSRLERFTPDRIGVEFPAARQEELDNAYQRYLSRRPEEVESTNEISQVGFQLARRLGHDAVYAIDLPMNLWDDRIQAFDDAHPQLRDQLRARWPAPVPTSAARDRQASLREMLVALNADDPPGNSEMYAGFLPLVEGDLYAGAYKLRPWYERNLAIVQNIFRISAPTDQRVLVVIGAGHLRVLKQIMEMTPQLCPTNVLEVLR